MAMNILKIPGVALAVYCKGAAAASGVAATS
jgi:hypothetical protein